MRNALLTSVGLLLAVPAFAQPTATTPRPGDAGAAMSTAPQTMPMGDTDRGMTGMRPMRGQQQHAQGMQGGMHHGQAMQHRGAAAGHRGGMQSGDAQDMGDMGDRAYDGSGGRVPTSTRASNTGARATRGEIAPRLPDPNAASSTPEGYLAAAERAIAARQTGRAQEALERAETRLLDRSTDPSMANTPDSNPAIQHLGAARQALGRGDTATARQLIQAARDTVGTGMGMQGAGMGQGMGMQGGQMGGMNQGMGMQGGQMGGMNQGMGMQGGQMGSMNQGMGMQGTGMGQGMGMQGTGMGQTMPGVGTQGRGNAQGVGAPGTGMVR